MIEKILNQFGLRDDEIKAFVFLLENGPQTAGTLAKKTGISRPSLYGFLRKLKETGLVTESQKDGIKTFFACTQERCETLFQEKITALEEDKRIIKTMYEMTSLTGFQISPRFQLFEGKEGLKQVLKDMLLYRNIETQAYWPIRAMVDLLGEQFFIDLNKERIKRKIYTCAIWPESQKLDIKKHPYLGFGEAFLREIRIAPKHISFSMGYWVYGNKVAFISSKKEAFGFIIESKELVEMLGTQFELMWSASKPISGKPDEGLDFLKQVR